MSAPIVGKVTAVVIDGKVTPVAGLAANAQPVAQAYAVRRDEEGSIELPVRPVVNPLQQEQQQREQQQHQREQEQRQQQEEEELKADDIEANIHNHNHNCAHVNDDDGIRVHAEDDPDYEERISVVYDDTRIRETKTAEELEAERKNEIKQHFSFFGGLYRGIKKQFHMKCFIASLFVWIFFFSSFAGGSIVAGFVIFYIIYTIEYCYSSSSVFIKGDIISSNDYLAYYNNVKTNRPQLTHEMDCTKTCSWTEVIETTHTTPAGYDSNGNWHCGSSYTTKNTIHHSDTETVCTDREDVEFDTWYDTTEGQQLDGIVTKLYSEKSWFGNNDRTCRMLDNQTTRFKNRHDHSSYSSGKYRYTYSSTYNLKYNIDGLIDRQIVTDEEELPYWLKNKRFVYNCMNIFMLGWFYRVWFSGVTGKTTITFEKVLVKN